MPQEQPTDLRRIRRSLAGALALVALDAAIGSFVFSLLLCPIWLFVSFIMAVIQRPGWNVGLARVLAPVVTLGLVMENATLQSRIAAANATQVIEACERFRHDQDHYPAELDELIPRYLPELPRAKYSLAYGEFSYMSQEGRHLLSCTVVPPFGRRIHDFERRGARTLD